MISICVVDRDGKTIARGACPADPQGGETDPILRMIADGFSAAHATLCQAAADLDKAVKKVATARKIAVSMLTLRKNETDHQWTEATA